MSKRFKESLWSHFKFGFLNGIDDIGAIYLAWTIFADKNVLLGLIVWLLCKAPLDRYVSKRLDHSS